MTHLEIIRKLIGPTTPVGETNSDIKRLENIKILSEVFEGLLKDLGDAAQYKDRHEASMKAIGEYAFNILCDTKQEFLVSEHKKVLRLERGLKIVDRMFNVPPDKLCDRCKGEDC